MLLTVPGTFMTMWKAYGEAVGQPGKAFLSYAIDYTNSRTYPMPPGPSGRIKLTFGPEQEWKIDALAESYNLTRGDYLRGMLHYFLTSKGFVEVFPERPMEELVDDDQAAWDALKAKIRIADKAAEEFHARREAKRLQTRLAHEQAVRDYEASCLLK